MSSESAFSQTTVLRVGQNHDEFSDVLAVEEPLEIRVGLHENGKLTHRSISITMRTPGDDAELAVGFLFTEGIISSPDQIKQIRHCGLRIGKATGVVDRAAALNSNTIRVDLQEGVDVDLKRFERHFYTSSSCGVCGKSSIDALRVSAKKIGRETGFRISTDVIRNLPPIALSSQTAFEKTGGLHASAIFDLEGDLETICEDVGRHNALDKAIGKRFLSGELPLKDKILLVSGRASFELVQKALMAGIPVLAAVGAPSSLSVELASEFGMTLIGFVSEERFNIYSGAERISLVPSLIAGTAFH